MKELEAIAAQDLPYHCRTLRSLMKSQILMMFQTVLWTSTISMTLKTNNPHLLACLHLPRLLETIVKREVLHLLIWDDLLLHLQRFELLWKRINIIVMYQLYVLLCFYVVWVNVIVFEHPIIVKFDFFRVIHNCHQTRLHYLCFIPKSERNTEPECCYDETTKKELVNVKAMEQPHKRPF